MKSILETGERRCHICGAASHLEKHHIYGGPLRSKSERYGLTVTLCHCCHNEPPFGVHHNRPTMLELKRRAQQRAMEHYGWSTEDFIREFGRNYLP